MEKIPASIRPYLDEIAQCLWSKNASIMVGAGLSMNAKPILENAKRFPSWQDLGDVFYEKVRGEEIKDAKYNFFDPLKLAYEVESNFGRSVLDSLLRANIPDSQYKPSELHHALLSLPWTDVFTTNYDTLLERSAELVYERNYKVVINKDNLVHSIPPRIVKLHGCFSASTPLIISEEDYRTYPQKFAPFVNTVQQTLLENTLCLIGFSGDDPNFLKWIGWIRDNLGIQNAAKIYLLGVLNLSTSQEKALTQYNITCVDMSVCEGISKNDHQAGLTAFINYCKSRKNDVNQKGWELSDARSYPRSNFTEVSTTGSGFDEFTALISLWKNERRSYPNWLIVPRDLRKRLWAYTESWSSIFDENKSIPLSIHKQFVYEFLWRKEKCLLPIFDNEAGLVRDVINSDFTDGIADYDRTFYIVLALLRYYREEGKTDEWQALFVSSQKHLKGQRSADYFTHERALYLLVEHKSVDLESLLASWSIGDSSASWMYKKAAILAEINKLADAKGVLEKALTVTRRKLNATELTIDYANLSLESYILVLLNNINYGLSIQSGDFSLTVDQEYKERLDELKYFQCDPILEVQFLELEIKHEPKPLKSIVTTNSFDIGRQNTTQYIGAENTEVLNAFRLLRFFEDASLLYSLPKIKFAVTGANNAIKRIADCASYWSMSTMLRTRDKNSVQLIFKRVSIAGYSSNFVDKLAERYIELLSGVVGEEPILYDYGNILPEALSRLCCKATLSVRDKLLELINQIYHDKPSRHKYASIDTLVKRLIESFNEDEILDRIKQFTEIACQVVINNGREVDSFTCPNPFNYLFRSLDREKTIKRSDVKISIATIKTFLNAMASENEEVRKNASIILISLKNSDLLNKNQTKSLLNKLLARQDKYGLPENSNFYKFAYIQLFEKKDEIKRAFHQFLLELSPLVQVTTDSPNTYTMTGRPDNYTKELLGGSKEICWSNKELHEHANKLVTWWNLDKKVCGQSDRADRYIDEMKCRFSLFVASIDVIIIQNDLNEYKETVSHIISEFETLNFDHLHLKAAAFNYLEYDKETFRVELEEALSTFEHDQVIDALRAISLIPQKLDEDDKWYLEVLGTFIKYSRGQFLTNAFQVVENILELRNVAFSLQFENTVLNALDRVANGLSLLDFDENLSLRKSAARLSYELKNYYSNADKNSPFVIDKWQKICKSDYEFAEVRKQWKK